MSQRDERLHVQLNGRITQRDATGQVREGVGAHGEALDQSWVAERRSVEELLAQARVKVGAITVRVEPAGAEVFVDGKAVGKAPLAGEVFVEPGARVIEAKLAGYEAAQACVDHVSAGAKCDVGGTASMEVRSSREGLGGGGGAVGCRRTRLRCRRTRLRCLRTRLRCRRTRLRCRRTRLRCTCPGSTSSTRLPSLSLPMSFD